MWKKTIIILFLISSSCFAGQIDSTFVLSDTAYIEDSYITSGSGFTNFLGNNQFYFGRTNVAYHTWIRFLSLPDAIWTVDSAYIRIYWENAYFYNTAGDSAGCILPGENKIKGRVINSTKYELIIIEKILEAIKKGEKVTLEIV